MSAAPARQPGERSPAPRARALSRALAALNVRYGPGTVSAGELPPPRGLATGVRALDEVTGCQGLPRGRISRLGGGPSSGAFDLGLALAAGVSRSATLAIVDFGGDLDPGGVAAYRGELANCWLVRPRHPEEGWAAARALARAGVSLCLLLAADWSQLTPDAAPAALQAALVEGGGVGLVLEGGQVPAALQERVCLELRCRRLEWARANGDVGGLRLAVQVSRSHLGAPGASCRLQLNFPRPYQSEVGPLELAAEPGEELLQLVGSG